MNKPGNIEDIRNLCDWCESNRDECISDAQYERAIAFSYLLLWLDYLIFLEEQKKT